MLLALLFAAMILPGGHTKTEDAKDTVQTLRSLFWQAGTNEDAITPFFAAANECQDSERALFKGYLGVATMMRARITGNPLKKWYFFNKGKVLLERAIDNKPDQVELRFLRLSVQKELPVILDYRSSIKNDCTFIVHHISDFMSENQANQKLGEKMLDFMVQKKLIDPSQRPVFTLNE